MKEFESIVKIKEYDKFHEATIIMTVWELDMELFASCILKLKELGYSFFQYDYSDGYYDDIEDFWWRFRKDK